MQLVREFWSLLTPTQRRWAVGAQFLSVAMALSTVLGIASITPFFAVLGDPAHIERRPVLAWLSHRIAFQDTRSFVAVLGFGFIGAVVIAKAGFASLAPHLHQARRLNEHVFQPDPTWQGPPHGEIRLSGVSFSFDSKLAPALREVSLCITAGSVVGLVGANGSGKTTLADVVAGLFVPTTGTVQVDGMTVDDRCRRSWQSCVAYVPQDIYLLDGTIAENIALGVDPKDIDSERMRDAAHRAQLADLIASLSDGYETRIGERGARVSGGQRQRIGIARALYANSSLLILDEATSSLDGAAEAEIMATVEGLRREKTIIVIAHRMSTLRYCDVIHEMESGRIVAHERALPTGMQA